MFLAFIKKLLGVKSPSAKANGLDYEFDYLRAKRLEKKYLKLCPDNTIISKTALKELEDIANAPILPDFHVFETVRQTTYKPVILNAVKLIEPELHRACYNDPQYINHLKYSLLRELEPEILNHVVIKTDFCKELGKYESKAYFKFFEEVDRC